MTCDVLVVGYGPVGAALTALLGGRGLRVTVVDRAVEPVPHPRAIALDDEVLRVLLRLPGLADLTEQVNGWQRATFVDARLDRLAELPFGHSALGLPPLAFFHQPRVERRLRAGIEGLPGVRVLLGSALVGLTQDAAGVTATLADGTTVRAGWAVGCDGAGSTVRRLLGVEFRGRTSGDPWLVVDAEVDAPLPHLPYFCYVCDPDRPAVTMPMPGGHRFEWLLAPGEDPDRVDVAALIGRFTDPATVTVVRTAVYTFSARMAAAWRVGRVLLAGDAAHCMPQFAGQGLGAGLRDAAALEWRLAEVVRGVRGPDLLAGYERERRPHVAAVTRLARLAGLIVSARDPRAAAAARTLLRGLDRSRLPGRFDPRPRSGATLPNPRVRTLAGQVTRLDRVLPWEWAVLSADDPTAALDVPAADRLAGRDPVALAVVRPGGLRAAAGLSCPAVEDLDGTLLRLLRRRRTVLARPDRLLDPIPRRSGK